MAVKFSPSYKRRLVRNEDEAAKLCDYMADRGYVLSAKVGKFPRMEICFGKSGNRRCPENYSMLKAILSWENNTHEY